MASILHACFPKSLKHKYTKVNLRKQALIDNYQFGCGDIGDITIYQDSSSYESIDNLIESHKELSFDDPITDTSITEVSSLSDTLFDKSDLISLDDISDNLLNISYPELTDKCITNKSKSKTEITITDINETYKNVNYSDKISAYNVYEKIRHRKNIKCTCKSCIDWIKINGKNESISNGVKSSDKVCKEDSSLDKTSKLDLLTFSIHRSISNDVKSEEKSADKSEEKSSFKSAVKSIVKNMFKSIVKSTDKVDKEDSSIDKTSNLDLITFSVHQSFSKILSIPTGRVDGDSTESSFSLESDNPTVKPRKSNKETVTAFNEIIKPERMSAVLTKKELVKLSVDTTNFGLSTSNYCGRNLWLYNIHIVDSIESTKDFLDCTIKGAKCKLQDFKPYSNFLPEHYTLWYKAKAHRDRQLNTFLLETFHVYLKVSQRFLTQNDICARCYTIVGFKRQNVLKATQWMFDEFDGFRSYAYTKMKAKVPPPFKF